jgi:hypothetical protein
MAQARTPSEQGREAVIDNGPSVTYPPALVGRCVICGKLLGCEINCAVVANDLDYLRVGPAGFPQYFDFVAYHANECRERKEFGAKAASLAQRALRLKSLFQRIGLFGHEFSPGCEMLSRRIGPRLGELAAWLTR